MVLVAFYQALLPQLISLKSLLSYIFVCLTILIILKYKPHAVCNNPILGSQRYVWMI